MAKGTGLGARLIARIKAKGYADPTAKFGIKVTEFALDHRYPPGFVYKWVGDVVVPEHETMLRLAKDLDTTPGWLHYGDGPAPTVSAGNQRRGRPVPIRGGSDGVKPPAGARPSGLQGEPTVCRVSGRQDEALCQLRGRTTAPAMQYLALTAARGARRRAA